MVMDFLLNNISELYMAYAIYISEVYMAYMQKRMVDTCHMADNGNIYGWQRTSELSTLICSLHKYLRDFFL